MTLDDLIRADFALVANWQRDAQNLAVCIEEHAAVIPNAPGLYLFVANGRVQYVGSAQESLRRRMGSYRRRQIDEKSSRPVHRHLTEEIDRGQRVAVYALAVPTEARAEWRGLRVHALIGIEAALIAEFDPPWNRRGRIRSLDTRAVNEDDETV